MPERVWAQAFPRCPPTTSRSLARVLSGSRKVSRADGKIHSLRAPACRRRNRSKTQPGGWIAAAARLPNVRIGIVPWGTRAQVFPLHGWDLHDRRAVIYGTADATAVLTEPRDVARYVMLTEAV